MNDLRQRRTKVRYQATAGTVLHLLYAFLFASSISDARNLLHAFGTGAYCAGVLFLVESIFTILSDMQIHSSTREKGSVRFHIEAAWPLKQICVNCLVTVSVAAIISTLSALLHHLLK